MTVGVLALQGGYDPHLRALAGLSGVTTILVRTVADLAAVDALVIPGGESTTIGKLLNLQGLTSPLLKRMAEGLPVFGTCAGMILLAVEVVGREQPLLGALDISVERNAYGRQTESFETQLSANLGGPNPQSIPAIFIRAPRIVRLGQGVTVLAEYEGSPVLVRSANVLAASFHPELTESSAVHRYFVSLVRT
ncbi:MAG: pyridoxal 5'-phosphate synthase glutaminase subunit PdxT [Spirochaetales bacterium]